MVVQAESTWSQTWAVQKRHGNESRETGKRGKLAKKERAVAFHQQHRGRKSDRQRGHLWGAESLAGEVRFGGKTEDPMGRFGVAGEGGFMSHSSSWGCGKCSSWDTQLLRNYVLCLVLTPEWKHRNCSSTKLVKWADVAAESSRPGNFIWSLTVSSAPDAWESLPEGPLLSSPLNSKQLYYRTKECGYLDPLLLFIFLGFWLASLLFRETLKLWCKIFVLAK